MFDTQQGYFLILLIPMREKTLTMQVKQKGNNADYTKKLAKT